MVVDADNGQVWLDRSGLLSATLDVDWDNESDEWLDHVAMALREAGVANGHQIRSRGPTAVVPFPHYLFVPASVTLHSRFVWAPLKEGGVVAAIEGDGEPSSDQIDPWLAALGVASERLGRSHTEFSWSAIVGPMPGAGELTNQALSAPASVGPLRIRPGGYRWQIPVLQCADAPEERLQ